MSRFSGLRIEDDSEEDEFTAILKGAKKAKKGLGGPSKATKNSAKGGVVEAAQSARKKAHSEATAEEWEEMDAKVTRAAFEVDLRKAIHASKISAEEEAMIKAALDAPPKPTPKPSKAKGKAKVVPPNPASSAAPPPPSLFRETEAEVARIVRSDNAAESVLVNLYRDKLAAASDTLATITEQSAKHAEEAKKYKERYKKLCELLKETEVKEKATLIVEVEKSGKVREELSEEIAALSAQLAQAKSRIHALEGKHNGEN